MRPPGGFRGGDTSVPTTGHTGPVLVSVRGSTQGAQAPTVHRHLPFSPLLLLSPPLATVFLRQLAGSDLRAQLIFISESSAIGERAPFERPDQQANTTTHPKYLNTLPQANSK